MSIEAAQNDIVEEFEFLEEWNDKYSHIIQLGGELEAYPEEFRNDDYRVRGCQSQVWLYPVHENGVIHFYGDSDALIVKGLVALLLRVFSDRSPAEIKEADLFFIDRIGLGTHLSPTRSNGLVAMIKQIKLYAVALSGA